MTLIYTAAKAMLRPRRISRDYLHVSLLAIFSISISLRIAEVLLGWRIA